MAVMNVELLAYQEPNVARIQTIFLDRNHAIDTSPLGAGKMFMATHLATTVLRFPHVIVVSPKSTLPKWHTMRDTYQLPVAKGHFMTYAALRGTTQNGVIKAHGLLSANMIAVQKKNEEEDQFAGRRGHWDLRDFLDDGDETQQKTQEEDDAATVMTTTRVFTPTDRLLAMAKEGCLLILDEFQHVKNPSSQQKAAAAIIACLNDFGSQSKTLLLSGSPIDKATQIITLYRTLGIATKSELFAKNRYLHRILWRRGAFYEVLRYHAELDAAATIAVIEEYHEEEGRLPYDFVDAMIRDIERSQQQKGGNEPIWFEMDETDATVTNMPSELFHQLLYRLFLHVTKQYHVSYCNDPKEMGGEEVTIDLKRYNAYYKIKGRDAERLQKAVEDLSRIVSYDAKENTVSFTNEGDGNGGMLGKLAHALMEIETAKIGRIIAAVRQHHEVNPDHKICICVNYRKSIARLVAAFKNEKPLVIHGGTSVEARGQAIKAFAAETKTAPYLLIGNTQVLCTGIDLDDKVGTRPRFCIVSPNYSGITLYQLSHRFHRQDSKSDAVVHMMYSQGNAYEVRILDALSRKGSIMKGVTQEQQNVLQYPCDYEDLVVDEGALEAEVSENDESVDEDDKSDDDNEKKEEKEKDDVQSKKDEGVGQEEVVENGKKEKQEDVQLAEALSTALQIT